ncbi:zinc ribbon domain-containing protein [Paenibacillus sp. UMB7766-LJ446]|uniref:zinc ribbon domain-containing protein n=1 Tax=Paenibacillus sp. UMB7766-LJ446 TaxID=3046313 RepID=UPI00254F5A2C|nr:zinc ribbon domain-containing protein [Paenibacillus sp. UMB7766-LJ446]MDK8194194.1 zinc ribbon domain-containing protein [Paenibacillus sp. UMB7766-LJ446]
MKLLQRIKNGANKATERAQHAVEIGKINNQIVGLQQEQEVHFTDMGRIFYEGYRAQDMTRAEKEMVDLSGLCDELQDEIDGLRNKIAQLKNERLCECGHVASLDANFCPKCGRKLGEFKPTAASVGATSPARQEAAVAHSPERPNYDAPTEEELEEAEPYHTVIPSIADLETESEYNSTEFTQEEKEAFDAEWERRRDEEMQRERERQQELDERIRYWKENNPIVNTVDVQTEVPREMVNCQICAAELPKGSKWCPRCGAEQI